MSPKMGSFMKTRTYSKIIVGVIKSFLEKQGWKYSFYNQAGYFHFGLEISEPIMKVDYLVDVYDNAYLVDVISPIHVDDDDKVMLITMADFLCRANYDIKYGSFVMDMESGDIRYKSYVDCTGITPTLEIVFNSIVYPASMFELFGKGISDILFCGATAEEAFNKCEMFYESVDDFNDDGCLFQRK